MLWMFVLKQSLEFPHKRVKLSWSDTYLFCVVSVCFYVPWCPPGYNRTRPSPRRSESQRSSDVPVWSGTIRCRSPCGESLGSPGHWQPTPRWQQTAAKRSPLPSWSKNPHNWQVHKANFLQEAFTTRFQHKVRSKASGLHLDGWKPYKGRAHQIRTPTSVVKPQRNPMQPQTKPVILKEGNKGNDTWIRAINTVLFSRSIWLHFQTWLHWMIH